MDAISLQDPPATQWTHHSKFYYPDGNICLAAQDTVFRVLKSQLARESAIFSDLFSIGESAAEGQDTYEGVPLVKLDDKPKELTALFTFLWCPRVSDITFVDLCSITRLASKYIIDHVSKWCLSRLDAIFPSGLKGVLKTLSYYKSNPGTAILVIELVHQCDLPKFLPMAFYHLSVTDAEHHSLGLDDLRRIILGKSRLSDMWWDFVRLSSDFGFDMLACSACQSVAAQHVVNGSPSPTVEALKRGGADPLGYLIRSDTKRVRGCGACSTASVGQSCLHATKIFSALPEVFDLQRKIKKLPRTQGITGGAGTS